MITGSSYKPIADGTNDFILDANYANAELASLAAIVPLMTSQNTIVRAGFLNIVNSTTPDQTTAPLRIAVTKLQQLIVAQDGSVDNFLAIGGIQVKGLFAALSSLLGFPISPQYVTH